MLRYYLIIIFFLSEHAAYLLYHIAEWVIWEAGHLCAHAAAAVVVFAMCYFVAYPYSASVVADCRAGNDHRSENGAVAANLVMKVDALAACLSRVCGDGLGTKNHLSFQALYVLVALGAHIHHRLGRGIQS